MQATVRYKAILVSHNFISTQPTCPDPERMLRLIKVNKEILLSVIMDAD
jgi:hypothetical protein